MPPARENMKKEIFETAKRLVREGGADSFNMRLVANECHIALGTIYNYYPSKADLLVSIMADIWTESFAEMENISAADFFEYLRKAYDILYSNVEGLRLSWFGTLASFRGNDERLSRSTESEYFGKFKNIMIANIRKYEDGLDKKVLESFGEAQLAEFIFYHFVGMLRSYQSSYDQFDYLLHKLLL